MANIWETIDENIKPLVEALNQLPGIVTFASCGGHKNPTKIQQPEGKWFVGFDANDTKGPETLIKAINNIRLDPKNYYFITLKLTFAPSRISGSISGDNILPHVVTNAVIEVAYGKQPE